MTKSGLHAIFPLILAAFFFSIIAVSASPIDATTFVQRGDTLLNTKNYSEAVLVYDQAISLDKNNFAAWNGKADALNRARDFTGALAASDTALAIDPSNTKGWMNRGYILYNLEKYDEELKAYETAISLEPDNAEAWFNKGYSLAGLKRYDEAIAAFDRVKTLDPGYPHLDANRKIAEQLRHEGTPAYIHYAPVIAGVLVLLIIIAGYIIHLNTKQKESDEAENDSRQSRRRKERQT